MRLFTFRSGPHGLQGGGIDVDRKLTAPCYHQKSSVKDAGRVRSRRSDCLLRIGSGGWRSARRFEPASGSAGK